MRMLLILFSIFLFSVAAAPSSYWAFLLFHCSFSELSFFFLLERWKLRFSAVDLKKCQYCDYRPKAFPPTTKKLSPPEQKHRVLFLQCHKHTQSEREGAKEILFGVWNISLLIHCLFFLRTMIEVCYVHMQWIAVCMSVVKIVRKVWPANKKFLVRQKKRRGNVAINWEGFCISVCIFIDDVAVSFCRCLQIYNGMASHFCENNYGI